MSVETIVFSKEQFTDILKRCWDHTPWEVRNFPGVREVAAPHIYDALQLYLINTPLRISHHLGQLGHESGKGKYTRELASGRAYEGRRDLGNTQKGDGVKFAGVGGIQLTGRNNVTRYARYKNRPDLIENPKLIAEPELAWDSAGWFWRFGTGARIDLNGVADKDNLKLLTKLINGGYNGFDDRKALTSTAKAVILAESTGIVQAALNASRLTPELVVDGAFGPRTASAVREFQAQFFMKADGVVNSRTWEQLKRFAE